MKLTTEFRTSLRNWGVGIEYFHCRYARGFDVWLTFLCFSLIIEVRV